MSVTVCFGANTYGYPEGGGHVWEYLNWALGLRAAGCSVLWLERPEGRLDDDLAGAVRRSLEPYGLADALVFDLDAAVGADLFLNLAYGPAPELPGTRLALLDIDPGLLQIWASRGWVDVSGYDVYFTIGETVGTRDARFPDLALEWLHAPRCVALDWWAQTPPVADAPFTTVSNWGTYDEWLNDGEAWYSNDKRDGFLPFLELPVHTSQTLELALSLAPDDDVERTLLAAHGWRVRDAESVSSTPWAYQRYIEQSAGEFSCAKPSCVRLQNAWVSSRTLGYLASGRPAVVQHTGPSALLPDAEGLFRFRTLEEAAEALETVAANRERHGRLARRLAEERFDARRIAGDLVERALA